MKKIAMLGTGAYGLALALKLAKNENEITMWTERQMLLDEFVETGKLSSIFTDKDIPSNIKLTTSYETCLKDADIIFISCAAKYVDNVCDAIKDIYKHNTPICIASKGIEETTGSFLSDIVKKTLNTENVSVLSGPTFAIDLANDQPSALALASTNEYTNNIIKTSLEGDTLKLRECDDLIGIHLYIHL